MLEQLWNDFLRLTEQLIIPDWGSLIAFMPVGVLVLVVLGLLWIIRRLVAAPPPRRGPVPAGPRTPAGLHMPGPSFSPIFTAIGTGLFFLGLVFGGLILLLGIGFLVLALLYWLAEGLRLYDRDAEPTRVLVPAPVEAAPPPGLHMPGPSFRPIMAALGTFLLLLGLVFGGWLLLAGVIGLVAGLVGWLADARREYLKTVEADRTGHLESLPAPRAPALLLAGIVFVVVAAAVLQSGLIGGSASGGTASPGPPGSPPGPPGSAAPGPPGSQAPGSQPPGPAADVSVVARGIAFVQTSWSGPADRLFTIAFTNEDAGTPHNIELKDPSGASVWKGDVFNGAETRVYEVPALPAATYTFLCTVHPTMTGTATLQ